MSDSEPPPVYLTDDQLLRLGQYAVAQQVQRGDVLIEPNDVDYDLIVIETGWVELTIAAVGEPDTIVARFGPRQFVGELGLLTGQSAFLTACVTEAGRVYRVSRQRFRDLMADDPEISDILLRAFLDRRDLLRAGPATKSLTILGSAHSRDSLELRSFAARQRLIHRWLDVDSPAGAALLASAHLASSDLPAVITADQRLARAAPGDLARVLGLGYRRTSGRLVDITVIGSGPAGLATAVYAASEGLKTVVVDSVGIGGQAAASSRIENYLGFPSGISGHDLTQRAALQAMKFGAELCSPCRVVNLDTGGQHLGITMSDGAQIESHAVLIATGVHYNKLPIDRWSDFEGAGIYYAATEMEARECNGAPVVVVGGANSAGQAALYLASAGSDVTLAIRGPQPALSMSSYLLARLEADPKVAIAVNSEVTEIEGTTSLERITITNNVTGTRTEQECCGLFCFIGAQPATGWLDDVDLQRDGSILTATHLAPTSSSRTRASLGRDPLPFETSVPAVFAAGDVRYGSMKRVAAAVGEGASAVQSVHAAIGLHS